MNEKQFKRLIGVTGAVISGEHWFTFSLSSLNTTSKYLRSQPQSVRKAYLTGAGLTLATAGLFSWLADDIFPLIAGAVLSAVVIGLYEHALAGGYWKEEKRLPKPIQPALGWISEQNSYRNPLSLV